MIERRDLRHAAFLRLLGIALLLMVSSRASAEEPPPRVTLAWTRTDESCIGGAELAATVERMTDRALFHGDGAPIAAVSGEVVALPSHEYAARVELRAADGRQIADRTFRTRGECRRLDGMVTLAVSLMLDDLTGAHAALRIPGEPGSPPPVPQALQLHLPEPPTLARASPSVTEHEEDAKAESAIPSAAGGAHGNGVDPAGRESAPSSRAPTRGASGAGAKALSLVLETSKTSLAVGAGADVEAGLLPSAAASASLHAELDLAGAIPVQATLRSYGPEGVTVNAGGTYSFSGLSLDVAGCPTLAWPDVRIGACVGLGAGLLAGGGSSGPLLFASALPSLAVRAVGPVWLRANAGMLVSFLSQTWTLPEATGAQVTVFRTSIAVPVAGVSLEYRSGRP